MSFLPFNPFSSFRSRGGLASSSSCFPSDERTKVGRCDVKRADVYMYTFYPPRFSSLERRRPHLGFNVLTRARGLDRRHRNFHFYLELKLFLSYFVRSSTRTMLSEHTIVTRQLAKTGSSPDRCFLPKGLRSASCVLSLLDISSFAYFSQSRPFPLRFDRFRSCPRAPTASVHVSRSLHILRPQSWAH